MNLFRDKRAIVSGGGSGIGRELCLQLAEAGASVCVADINGDGAAKTAAAIVAAGGRAETAQIDMRDYAAVEALVAAVAAKGPLDYMFNNAGVIMFGEFRDMECENWRHFIDSDVMTVVHGTKAAYTAMLAQRHGHIVNVSSVFGLFPFALGTGYSAVKHAVVGLSLALRPEAQGFGIRVSVACPGSVDTEVRNTYQILGGSRERFNSFIMKQLTPQDTARRILRGVSKNKSVIAFPAYDLIPWWLYRLHPSLNDWWQRRVVTLFRDKIRLAPGEAPSAGGER